MSHSQRKHIIAYYDASGGKLWTLLKPILEKHLPLTDITWKSRVITPPPSISTLPVDIIPSTDKRLIFPDHVSDRYRTPYLHLFIVSGDDSDDYKSKLRPVVRDWVSSHHHSQWLVVVVSTFPQPTKLFYVPIAERLKSDLPKKDRVCSLKLDETANEEQWIELLYKMKDSIVSTFDQNTSEIIEEVQRLQSVRHRPGWNFAPFFLVKECLALTFEISQLPEAALVQYVELETTFLDHCGLERNTGMIDTSWSQSHISQSSTATLLSTNDKDYRQLIAERKLSRFDFHQYLFACQAKLSFLVKQPETVLTKAIKFIVAAHKELLSKANGLPPLFAEAWAFSASFTIAMACLEQMVDIQPEYQKQKQKQVSSIPGLLEVTSMNTQSITTPPNQNSKPTTTPTTYTTSTIAHKRSSSNESSPLSISIISTLNNLQSQLSQPSISVAPTTTPTPTTTTINTSGAIPVNDDKAEKIANQMHFSIANLFFNARTELEKIGSVCGFCDPHGTFHSLLVELNELLRPGQKLKERTSSVRPIVLGGATDDEITIPRSSSACSSPSINSNSETTTNSAMTNTTVENATPGVVSVNLDANIPITTTPTPIPPAITQSETTQNPNVDQKASQISTQTQNQLSPQPSPSPSNDQKPTPQLSQSQNQQQQPQNNVPKTPSSGIPRALSNTRLTFTAPPNKAASSRTSMDIQRRSSPPSSPPLSRKIHTSGQSQTQQVHKKEVESINAMPQLFWRPHSTHLPESLSQTDVRKAIDNPKLVAALENTDAFDKLYIDLTEKAQEEYINSKRFRAVQRLTRELAILHFKRKRWQQAETLLNHVFIEYMNNKWTEIAFYILVLLSHCQLTLGHYSEFVGSCLLFLSPNFSLPEEERIKTSEQLFTTAIPQIATPIVKLIDPSILNFEISSPPDSKCEYFVGETISMLCKIHSIFPISFNTDRISLQLSSPNSSTIELFTEKQPINPGDNSFILSTIGKIGGTFQCDKIWITIGNLSLSQQPIKAQPLPIVLKFIQSTFSMDLQFPKWLPLDKALENMPISFKTCKDDISELSIAISSSTGFSIPNGTQMNYIINGSNNSETKMVSMAENFTLSGLCFDEQILLSLPIPIQKTPILHQINITASFKTPLIGQVSVSKSSKIVFSSPFTVSCWQTPFSSSSTKTLVQIIAKNTAKIPLLIRKIHLDNETSQPLINTSPYNGSNVLLQPEHEVSVSFIIENAPEIAEIWKVFIDYEFSFHNEASTFALRTHSADVIVGYQRPSIALDVDLPSVVALGTPFPLHIIVKRILPQDKDQDNFANGVQLQVKSADPRYWVIQGFRTRSIILPKNVDETTECNLKLVPLQSGNLSLPTLSLIPFNGNSSAVVVSVSNTTISTKSKHVTVLPEAKHYLSCQQEPQNQTKKQSRQENESVSVQGDIAVCWLDDSATRAINSIQKLTERFKEVSGLQASARHFKTLAKLIEWLETQQKFQNGIERKLRIVTTRNRKDDGDDIAAHRVVLFFRQSPIYYEVPIVIFCSETFRVDDLMKQPNVTVTPDFTEVGNICTALNNNNNNSGNKLLRTVSTQRSNSPLGLIDDLGPQPLNKPPHP